MPNYTVTRKLEIDAAHRITTHGSKCRHIHGHRYTIEVTCGADMLVTEGTETDMVLDFSFIKNELIRQIEDPCDHGFILSIHDDEMLARLCPDNTDYEVWKTELKNDIQQKGYCATQNSHMETRLYIIATESTAECLARHWYEKLEPVFRHINDSNVILQEVKVWETPNCFAVYRG